MGHPKRVLFCFVIGNTLDSTYSSGGEESLVAGINFASQGVYKADNSDYLKHFVSLHV